MSKFDIDDIKSKLREIRLESRLIKAELRIYVVLMLILMLYLADK